MLKSLNLPLPPRKHDLPLPGNMTTNTIRRYPDPRLARVKAGDPIRKANKKQKD
jgi:hypothetical protein